MATPSLLFQNPNAPGVAAVPGINSVGALPMPTNSTLVRDPITGIFSSNMDPDGNNQSTVAANGGTVPSGTTADAAAIGNTSGGSGAGAQADPYSIFIGNLTAMLKDAQAKNATAQAGLGGAKDTLTNEAVSNGTPTPFMPGIFSGAQVGNQENVENAFQPAISSINTQMENENTSLSDINSLAGTIASYYKPEAISPGQSLVMPDGTVVQGGHSYTPQVNPQTGLIDGFDQNTGTWSSQDQSSTANSGSIPQTTSNVSSGIVGGVDLSGASVGMQPWATDPNYASEVNTLYQQVQNAQPSGIPTAPGIDAFIKSMAKGSPITGAMIMNAATTYKIDPNLLTAVIGHESDFGSSGTTTLQINNPAGITGSDGKYTPFNSWTQGVNATAADLAKRIVSPNNPGTSGTSNVGGQLNPQAQSQVSKLPSAVQQYVQAGIYGTAYIDATRVPDQMTTSVQNLAAANGIPYLTAADVATAQALDGVQQNMALMKTTAQQTLGSGFLGGVGDVLATGANYATFGNAFPNFGQFNEYATAAVGILKGLAGSGGGFRITQSEIDTAQANIPTSTDTIQNAEKKIQVLQGLVNTTVAKVFPDAPVPILLPDGTQATVPAKNYSAAVTAGALPQ